MKYIKIFEDYNEKEVILKHKNNPSIEISFKIKGGRITDIKNERNVRFPYENGQMYNRGMETWCCNNDYLYNGKDTCSEPKIFGIKASDIPLGHELRFLMPHKFRK